jgi:hypothetical protein
VHTPETKAKVLSALLMGVAIAECVRQFGVPKATVLRWQQSAAVAVSDPTSPDSGPILDLSWVPVRGRDWQDNFQRYIDDSLYSMRVQVAYLSRPDVLERSDYAAIVDAHGSLADRIARLADTIGRVEEVGLDHQPASASEPRDATLGAPAGAAG